MSFICQGKSRNEARLVGVVKFEMPLDIQVEISGRHLHIQIYSSDCCQSKAVGLESQMEELGYREANECSQGHTAGKWQSWDCSRIYAFKHFDVLLISI